MLGLTCLLVPSCRIPEEMIVEFATNIPCSSFDHLDVAVASLPWRAEADVQAGQPAVTARRCSNGALGQLVITRSDPELASLFAVLAYRNAPTAQDCARGKPEDCVFARRRVRFVPNTVLKLKVGLLAECKGITCTILSTCAAGGRCLSSSVDCAEDGSCKESEELVDGGGRSDRAVEPNIADAGRSADASDAMDAGDGNSVLRLNCGATECSQPYCCLRSVAFGGASCLSSASSCITMMSTRVACYANDQCPPSAPYCLFVGTHGGSGYGYTECSTKVAPLGQEMACRTDPECFDVGYGAGEGYACRSHATPTMNFHIGTCSKMN